MSVTPRPDKFATLRHLPLFAGCTSQELDEIDRLADRVTIEAGRTVIRQGDLGQEFALIIDGEADVMRDDKVVATLGPGDFFGEVALIESINRTASVVAKTDLTLEVLDRRGFNTLLDELPRLARSILKGVTHRLAEREEEIDQLRAELDQVAGA